MSNIIEKIKDTIHHKHADPERDHGLHNTTADPHYVDNTYGSHKPSAMAANTAINTTTGTGIGVGAASNTVGPASNTAGPHASNLANKLDPRVDSNLDGSTTIGNFGSAHTAGAGTGVGAASATAGPASNTAGLHSSNLANKLDPTVDSDLDGSATIGNKIGYSSNVNAPPGVAAGMGYHHGQHHNNLGGNLGSNTGPGSNTTGPHSSNLANKLDPTVDSDLHNSKRL